jgi:hypothetical protein
MPSPLIAKFAKKIKNRKEFADVKDKEQSAERHVEKKWKESEDIVKKQYKKSDGGKYYGTLIKILKSKLQVEGHVTFSEFIETCESEKNSDIID